QKQARIGFDEAANIIRCDNRFGTRLKIVDHRNRISYPAEGTFYEAISSDAGTQHGRTPVFILADELHAWKKRDLWDVLRSGLPKTKGALVVIATTAGRGQDNVAHELYDYARKVARGDIEDPAFLPILFEAPRDCDWRDEAIWRHVNPGLAHGYPDIDGLRQLAREAENRPGDRESFRQLHLNIWLDHSTSPFVEMAIYDRGSAAVDPDALRGRPCWIGVDLSSTIDLTAVVAAWRDGDGGYVVVPWFFCPADALRARADRDGVPYPRWRDEGFITTTPGDAVDYDYVEQHIRDLCETYDVQEIAFDPHLARRSLMRLRDEGLPAIEHRQGWVSMAPAIKELERAIISGKLQHGGHPVLRWCFSNIALHTDQAGNSLFHKGKSTDRIDGAQAAAMAVGRAFVGESNVSAYNAPESPGLFIF
ncbi:MAG: terminase large subunit, partial [Mesorhizobium sp.]